MLCLTYGLSHRSGRLADCRRQRREAVPLPRATTTSRSKCTAAASSTCDRRPGPLRFPALGEAFTTFLGLPSRRASSWYFGDGAVLFNSLPTSLRQGQSITALDPALGAVPKRKSSGGFGARVGYPITSWLTAEFSLDYGLGAWELEEDTLAQIEATRASFSASWTGLTAAGGFSSPSVASTATITNDEGRQLLTVGAAVFKLPELGPVTPFVVGGAGLASNLGDTPSVTLTGTYTFTTSVTFTETDTVVVRYEPEQHELVGVFGGGFTYAVSPRSGVRVDVRTHVSKNTLHTTLDATPSVQVRTPSDALASFSIPSVQFSNNPTVTGQRSTLTAPAVNGFETFETSGWAQRVNFTAGYYFRF